MFGRVPRSKRCPVPGCKNRGTPVFLGVDVCGEHQEQRAQAARDAWIDPATLEAEVWVDDGVPKPCVCGHPRWAHSRPGYYDGPCLVPECVACDGEEGHSPGFIPAHARD